MSKLPSPKVWRKLRHENLKKCKQKGYHYFTHLKHFAVFLNLHWFYLFPYNILHQTKTVFDGQNYAFDNLSCINDFLLHKKMRNDWQWVNINSEGEFLFSCTCIFTRFLWKESFYGQINLIYKTIGIFIWECRTVNRKDQLWRSWSHIFIISYGNNLAVY